MSFEMTNLVTFVVSTTALCPHPSQKEKEVKMKKEAALRFSDLTARIQQKRQTSYVLISIYRLPSLSVLYPTHRISF